MANEEIQVYTGDDDGIERVDISAVAVMNRSDVDAQLAAAKRYPRAIKRYLDEAIELATMTRDIAESCMYAVPREGKMIDGPSVRMAEICASAYGNLHIASRVLDEGETSVVAQGVAWDLQKNVRISVETRRRITTRAGRRYSDDMVITTGNAAASIALRNAVFRIIPRSLVQPVYMAARACSVGDLKTLGARRVEVFERLKKVGVAPERIHARLNGKAMPDIGLDDIALLISLGTAMASGGMTIDEAFPEVDATKVTTAPAEEGRRVSMRGAAAKAPSGPQEAPAPGKAASAPVATDTPAGEPPLGVLDGDPKP